MGLLASSLVLSLTLESTPEGWVSRHAVLIPGAAPAVHTLGPGPQLELRAVDGQVVARPPFPPLSEYRDVPLPEGGGEVARVSPRFVRLKVPWPDDAAALHLDGRRLVQHPARLTEPRSDDLLPIHVGADRERGRRLLILSEGYTAGRQDAFLDDAAAVVDHMRRVDPWGAYARLFHVDASFVPSVDGGIDRAPRTDEVDSAFGCFYGCGGLDRLICCRERDIVDHAAAVAPDADGILLLIDDEPYGGSGGFVFATSYNGAFMEQVALHELSHALVLLWDEYDYDIPGQPHGDPGPNCAPPASDPLPWEPWLGEDGVDAFPVCSFTTWLRPTDNACIMRELQDRYCPVCREHVVQSLYASRGAGPLHSVEPAPGSLLVTPQAPLRLSADAVSPPDVSLWTWRLDGEVLSTSGPDLDLGCPHEARRLVLTVEDLTPWVRSDDPFPLIDEVVWSLDTSACPAPPREPPPEDTQGCGCSSPASSSGPWGLVGLPWLVAALLGRRRRSPESP